MKAIVQSLATQQGAQSGASKVETKSDSMEVEEDDGAEGETEEKPEDTKKEFTLKTDSLKGSYAKKTDFKLADQILKTTVSKIKTETQTIVDDIFEDLYDQLQKKRIIQTQKLDKVDTIQLKYLSKLQIALKKQFRNLYNDAQSMAKTEVKKSDFATNIPADEFLDFLESETFQFVGDWSYNITKKTKQELIAAIKDGKPLSDVISVMSNQGRELSDVALERYARTKTTEVFNRGRMEYFNSTGVVEAYQYSAILDDVTSEICGNLNGLIFPKEEAPVPPLHFNCRSVLIPITRFEDWSADKAANNGQNVDKFLEKNVSDKGFPIN
jgi:SPP1 gp7 family putative phage head morphogenesis protein